MASKSGATAGLHPIGELDDGTPFFSPLGELQMVDDGDRVICHLCGRAMQLLSAEHLRRHGWTPQLYRSMFGLNRSTALCSPAVAERRRAIGSTAASAMREFAADSRTGKNSRAQGGCSSCPMRFSGPARRHWSGGYAAAR
jgi:hypothetical protein